MEKQFDPAAYEGRWQRAWSEQDLFRAADRARPAFCIMIPPPNVTGSLHIGHALQSTLQDLLTRWKRMQGYNALWLPGTDHAGIATQLMVERQLLAEDTSRRELGRERFLERMWAWTEEHHGHIKRQLDQLGASCDWSRERFTLDEGMSAAVREAFVRLFDAGLVYRAEYMVNWSPVLDTAISDLEVEMREVAGKLYHIAYPLTGSDERIEIVTTRPETMLGDTAIAFHPEDERYRRLAGRRARLPLVGRELPLIADPVVLRDFGTGLVKVTPAHDPADFELGRRHGLPMIQVIDRHGRMTAEAGEAFAGLDRFEARSRVVEALRQGGYLVRVDDTVHNVGHCQRSGVPIEPLVSTQWFCEVSEMAARALESVRSGDVRLVPDTWVKTWEHWLETIRPWCISRQLWWGHQIPAWYDAEGRCWVGRDVDEAAARAGVEAAALTRDEDVLDTWFSSALWPFSTLGWPRETDDLATFYPTDVLVTGFDILFFWVARMAMAGLHFTGKPPFRVVHLTGLVRDAEGQKMSKTRGNTVDPLELVREFGADALRFTLAALDSPGRDIPLDRERMAGYRAFGNKIWNAVRFALSRLPPEARVPERLEPGSLEEPERWMLSRLDAAAAAIGQSLEDLRFDEACHTLYHFFWGDLCDWYLELTKPALSGAQARPGVGEVLLAALDRSLRLLHPVMPFLTEELWQRLPGHEAIDSRSICLAPYPQPVPGWSDAGVEARMAQLFAIVNRVRALRAELRVPPAERLDLYLWSEEPELRDFFARQRPLSAFLLRLGEQHLAEVPATACRDRVGAITIGLSAAGRDLAEERRHRLALEATAAEKEASRLDGLLADESFVTRAPATVVEAQRRRRTELGERLAVIREALAG